MKKLGILFFCFILFVRNSFAADYSVENIGDMLAMMVPAWALGMTMMEPDYEGSKQFAYSYGATMLTELGLKRTVEEERPNGKNKQSFPSGHTASAFSGATFIHKRYGFKQAIIPYALATFVGYSRVESEWHYTHDVVAGAVIAGLWSWVFTDSFRLTADSTGAKLDFNVKF